jgi:hypothetical protein
MFISRQWLNRPVPAITDINGTEELLEAETLYGPCQGHISKTTRMNDRLRGLHESQICETVNYSEPSMTVPARSSSNLSD